MKKITRENQEKRLFYGYKNFIRSLRNKKSKPQDNQRSIEIMHLPEKLDVRNPRYRGELLDILVVMREVLKEGRDIALSFDNVQIPIMPDAMILLIAERKRLMQEFPTRQIYCKRHRGGGTRAGRVINQLLEKFDLITTSHKIISEDNLVKNWQYEEGVNDDYDIDQRTLLKSIVEFFKNQSHYPPSNFEKLINKQSLDKRLYGNLTEATTNASRHAYDQPRFKDEKELGIEDSRWWMFKAVNLKKKLLTVVVCDRGIGIPISLKIKADNSPKEFGLQMLEKLKDLVLKERDHSLIELALEYGKTRTKKSERGKGLTQIVDTIENTPGASLVILSNKGFLEIRNNEHGKVKRKSKNLTDSINGTIISWYLPLKGDIPNE